MRAVPAAAAVALAAAAALSGCARRGVIAEGWAPLGPGGPREARQLALAQAERAAVERETGVSLAARVRVERGVAVEQSLTARSAGRVEGYEVVSEGPADGGWRARIRAVVARGAPRPEVSLGALPETLADGAREGFQRSGVALTRDSDLTIAGSVDDAEAPAAGGWPAWRARVRLELRGPDGVLAARSAEAAAVGSSEAAARREADRRAARACAERLASSLAAAR